MDFIGASSNKILSQLLPDRPISDILKIRPWFESRGRFAFRVRGRSLRSLNAGAEHRGPKPDASRAVTRATGHRNGRRLFALPFMARYFFNLVAGTRVADTDGAECSSLQAVKETARGIASEYARNKWQTEIAGAYICVNDASGAEVFRTPVDHGRR
jgi:hypothetical protein